MFRRPGPRVKFLELLRDGLNRDKYLNKTNPYHKLNRFIGSTLAWFFLQTTITANQVTISLLVSYYIGLTIISVAGFLKGSFFWWVIAGFAFIFLGDMLDLADGIVGRRNIADGIRKNKIDRFRVILLAAEHHEGMPALVLIAVSINYVLATGDLLPFILGALAGVFEAKTFHLLRLRDFLMIRFDQKDAFGGIRSDTKYIFAESSLKKKLIELSSTPLKYLVLIALISFIFNQTKWILIFYGLFISLRFLAFYGYTYLRFKQIEDSRVEE
jgi:hypothetical protein